MRSSPALLFSLVLVALFAWALFEARAFRAEARLFPLVIGSVGLALAVLNVGMQLRRGESPAGDSRPSEPDLASAVELALRPAPTASLSGEAEVVVVPGGPQAEYQVEPIKPELRRRRTAAILGWIAAFTLGIWLLGFSLAVPLAIFAYLKLGSGERWLTSVVYAAACGSLFYGIFVLALRIPFPEGLLISRVFPDGLPILPTLG